jgi:hypothetical protein
MEIRLGKAQIIKATDDGGVSMSFEGYSSQRPRRVVLSIEALSSIYFLTIRPDGKSAPRRVMKILQTVTLLIYTPQFLVKFVGLNTIMSWTMNIKKYPPDIIIHNSPL